MFCLLQIKIFFLKMSEELITNFSGIFLFSSKMEGLQPDL